MQSPVDYQIIQSSRWKQWPMSAHTEDRDWMKFWRNFLFKCMRNMVEGESSGGEEKGKDLICWNWFKCRVWKLLYASFVFLEMWWLDFVKRNASELRVFIFANVAYCVELGGCKILVSFMKGILYRVNYYSKVHMSPVFKCPKNKASALPDF